MKKLLIVLSLFVSPLVAMDEDQRRGHAEPIARLVHLMSEMGNQRHVCLPHMDRLLGEVLAENWGEFQEAAKDYCDVPATKYEVLFKKITEDSEPLIAKMVKNMVAGFLIGQECDTDSKREEIVKGLLAEDGGEIQCSVKGQLERIAGILSMARKVHVAKQESKS